MQTKSLIPILYIVGWVERGKTQHEDPRWISRCLTQPTLNAQF